MMFLFQVPFGIGKCFVKTCFTCQSKRAMSVRVVMSLSWQNDTLHLQAITS